jgi:hypothetical protein
MAGDLVQQLKDKFPTIDIVSGSGFLNITGLRNP